MKRSYDSLVRAKGKSYDYVPFMNSDLLIQFRDVYDEIDDEHSKPNTKALIEVLAEQLNEVITAFRDIYRKTYFSVLEEGDSEDEKARAVQLDGIGEIVGMSRKTASAVSSLVKSTAELDLKQGSSDFERYLATNEFLGYVDGAVLDDIPYSKALDYKIFLNNAWCTYDDLITSIRHWWPEEENSAVHYEERLEEDARIYLIADDVYQDEDGGFPLKKNYNEFFLMPLVKAAGVELIRRACLIFNTIEKKLFLAAGFSAGVFECNLPYYLFEHKFREKPYISAVAEETSITILGDYHSAYERMFTLVKYRYADAWLVAVNREMAKDLGRIVFPSYYDGHKIEGAAAFGDPDDESNPFRSSIEMMCEEVVLPETYRWYQDDVFANYTKLKRIDFGMLGTEDDPQVFEYTLNGCGSLKIVTMDLGSYIEGGEGFIKGCNLDLLVVAKPMWPFDYAHMIPDGEYGATVKSLLYGGDRRTARHNLERWYQCGILTGANVEFNVGSPYAETANAKLVPASGSPVIIERYRIAETNNDDVLNGTIDRAYGARFVSRADDVCDYASYPEGHVRFEQYIVYGFENYPAIDELDNYIVVTNGGYYEAVPANEHVNIVGTGTKINVYDSNGNFCETIYIVVFGDVDGDGIWSIEDLARITYMAEGSDEPYYIRTAADLNQDGKIDEEDVRLAQIVQLDRRFPNQFTGKIENN